MMTKKRIMNKIKVEFKGKALRAGSFHSCQYLTGDGKKCAIGLFIPDGHEGQRSVADVLGLLENHPDLREHMPSNNLYFLELFQSKHDDMDKDLTVEKQKDYLIDWINNNYDDFDHN